MAGPAELSYSSYDTAPGRHDGAQRFKTAARALPARERKDQSGASWPGMVIRGALERDEAFRLVANEHSRAFPRKCADRGHGPAIAHSPAMSLRSAAPFLSAVTLLLSVSSTAAPAERRPVTLDSTVATTSANSATQRVLRETVERELSTVDFGNVPYRGHYAVSVALLKLRHAETNHKKAICEMGLALRDAHDLLVVSISGRATAESADGDESSLDAMKAAAHSAVSRLPEAVRAFEKK